MSQFSIDLLRKKHMNLLNCYILKNIWLLSLFSLVKIN